MIKNIKKILSVILAMSIIFSFSTLMVSAVEETSGTCGENLTWTFDESTCTLEINGTGKMTFWTSESLVPWDNFRKSIKEVRIDEDVTSIGRLAFRRCADLENISIPKNIETIGFDAFEYCYKLKSISVDADNKYFSNDTYGVLFNKDKTELIQYPIGNERTEYTIPDTVKTIGSSSFEYAINLDNVKIPDSVTDIESKAFYGCHNLSNMKIGDSVESIGSWVFSHCYKLTSIVLPDSVTSIGDYAFNSCEKITNITLTNSVTSIGNGAFLNASNLTDVYFFGSKDEWNKIKIGEDNDYLTESEIHFNYETHKHSYTLEITEEISENQGLISGICTECGIECISFECKKIADKEIEITRFDGIATEVNIPEVIGGYMITSIGDYAFFDCSNIKNITVPDSVTKIGSFAFNKCYQLESIKLSESVKRINEYTFLGCDNLKSIIIPDSVTSIGRGVFWYCDKLESVILSENLTSVSDGAFTGCVNLEEIYIPKSVRTMGFSVFSECTNLKKITVEKDNPNYISDEQGILFNKNKTIIKYYPAGNTNTQYSIPETVTTIDKAAFDSAINLEKVTIPDTVNVVEEQVFRKCRKLKEIYIPESVSFIGPKAFALCDSLESVIITENVESIETNTFSDCKNLKSITFTDSVASIGESAFYNCNELKDVYFIGNKARWNEIDVKEGNEDLLGATIHYNSTVRHNHSYTSAVTKEASCTENGIITYTCECGGDVYKETVKASGHIYENENCIKCGEGLNYSCGKNLTWSFDKSTGTLEISGTGEMTNWESEYDVPWAHVRSDIKNIKINNGVTSIGNRAFYDCDNFTNVVIPDSVISIGEWSFHRCKSLADIDFGNSIKTIGRYAFHACTGLTSVEIPDSVTVIENNVFSSCSNLIDLTISHSVTRIGDSAFFACEKLTDITIPESVISLGSGAFSNTGYYKNKNNWENDALYIGDCLLTVKTTATGSYKIKENTRVIASRAFADCHYLTSITVPDTVTSIGIRAFFNCDGLTNIALPDSVIYLESNAFESCRKLETVTLGNSIEKIEEFVFSDCYKLKNIIIPDSVTSIEEKAFYLCESLESVTIPASVTSIGNYVFNGCFSLRNVYYGGSEAQWEELLNGTTNDFLIFSTIHYNYKPGAEHVHSYTSEVTKAATCTKTGVKTFTCGCGDNYTEEIKENGHQWGEWKVVIKPTEEKQGSESSTCSGCKSVKYRAIPKLETQSEPEKKVHDVQISDFTMRYRGEYRLQPEITVADGVKYTVKYKSDDPTIASVDNNGKVTSIKGGKVRKDVGGYTKITCIVEDENGNVTETTCKVTVEYTWWQWILRILTMGLY